MKGGGKGGDERASSAPPPGPPSSTAVRADDRGLLYGDGLFETMLAVDGVLDDASRHLDRLAAGALVLGIAFDASAARKLAEDAARGRPGESAVRLTLTRGPGAGLGTLGAGPPTLLSRAGPVPWSDRHRAEGVAAVFASRRRVPAACLEPSLKSLNYLPNVLARMEAERRGAEEALFLGLDGGAVEGTVSNVFAVVGGALATPALAEGCFPGLARADVLALARAEGLRVEERRILPAEIAGADEAFLTSTLAGVLPLVRLEGADVAAGVPGPVTRRLQTLYRGLVTSRLPNGNVRNGRA